MKLSLDVLLPVIANIVNCSLQTGYFPIVWQEALVNPALKRNGLDLINENYRPISNLSFMSKITERAAAEQTHLHMTEHNWFPPCQSAYRKYHSTETALQ